MDRKYRRSPEPDRWIHWLLSFGKTNLTCLTRDEWDTLKNEISEFCILASSSPNRKGMSIHPSEHLWKKRGPGLNIKLNNKEIASIQRSFQIGTSRLFAQQEEATEGAKGDVGLRDWKFPATIQGVQVSRA